MMSRLFSRSALEKNWVAAGLIAATAAGACLRFYCLGEWSLWQDEAYTWRDAKVALGSGFLSHSISNKMIAWTISLLGESEWTLRLYPALIGVLTIPVLFFAIRRIFDPQVALIAVSLIATSHWHLYFSQNARFYTSLMLFYGLALFAFILWSETRTKIYLLGAIAFLLVAVHERMIAFVLLPVVAVSLGLIYAFGVKWKPNIRVRTVALIFVLLGCVCAVYAGAFVRAPETWTAAFGWANNSAFWLVGVMAFYLGIPLVVIACVGALYLFRNRPITALTLISAAIVPILILILISPFHYTASRYAFLTLPAWVILASYGICFLLKKRDQAVRVFAVAIFLTVVFHSLGENYLYFSEQRGNRTDWKPAFKYLQTHRKESDRVFVPTLVLGQFYMGRGVEAIGQLNLDELTPSAERVWFLEDMTTKDKHPRILVWFQEHAREVANFDVWVRARNFRLRIYLYESEFLEPAQPLTHARFE